MTIRISYFNQLFHHQPRLLENLRWVHFDQKCLAVNSQWGGNGPDARQYEKWYISSNFHHYASEGINNVLPGAPWNVGCDLSKFV